MFQKLIIPYDNSNYNKFNIICIEYELKRRQKRLRKNINVVSGLSDKTLDRRVNN